jgi:hypothetical protein
MMDVFLELLVTAMEDFRMCCAARVVSDNDLRAFLDGWFSTTQREARRRMEDACILTWQL